MSNTFAGSTTRTMESADREIETRLAEAPYEDRIKAIADKHGVDPAKIREQLRIGIQVEKEHGGTPEQQAKTALDHLDEKADYYDKLRDAGLKRMAGERGNIEYVIGQVEKIKQGHSDKDALVRWLNEARRLAPSLDVRRILDRLGVEIYEQDHRTSEGMTKIAQTAISVRDEIKRKVGLKRLEGTETAWTKGETSSGPHVNADSKAFEEQDAQDQLDQKEQIRGARPTNINDQIAEGPRHIANEKGLSALDSKVEMRLAEEPGSGWAIQSIVISKDHAESASEARKVAAKYAKGDPGEVDETSSGFRYRQKQPGQFGMYRTFNPEDGVAIVYGKLKK